MNAAETKSPAAGTTPEANPSALEKEEPGLIRFVRGLKDRDDRGALATLRGALSNSEERQIRAYPLLAPFGGIPSGDAKQRYHADLVRILAGLMTLPNMHSERTGRNFGYSCRRLLGDEERKTLGKPEQPGPVGRRVMHLLAATREEVLDRVCSLARRIANAEGNIDFSMLYEDLRDWRWEGSTKAKWAASFWGAEIEEDANQGGNQQ
ncbi:MAG: type I-E CRISPR-associated protein Cse2/CasB [Prosthecobacter sp.]|nr:type I-E CRISPR-associated protein Cse2/CasB [Prosthecobacter sp.]